MPWAMPLMECPVTGTGGSAVPWKGHWKRGEDTAGCSSQGKLRGLSGICKGREKLTGKSTFRGKEAVVRIKAPKWEQAYNHALKVRSLQI